MNTHSWLTILMMLCCALPVQAERMAAETSPDVARQHALTRFVRQECGFCHGLRLTGGLGSPLTAPALHDKPAEALTATILQGRPGTAMPGWTPFLSEADTLWIVAQLQKGFPE